jgi:hypothetical protein
LAHTRFHKLYSQYLQACAAGQGQTWSPRVSGGDHRPDWPAEVNALLTKLLSPKPASSYSACASELLRRLNFETNRASVRRWALQNHLVPDTCYKPAPKPVKRWQAHEEGALSAEEVATEAQQLHQLWTTMEPGEKRTIVEAITEKIVVGRARSTSLSATFPLVKIWQEGGGRGGIRTHGTVARTSDFESGAFNHSATLPSPHREMVRAAGLEPATPSV